jgi:hypothetical protein
MFSGAEFSRGKTARISKGPLNLVRPFTEAEANIAFNLRLQGVSEKEINRRIEALRPLVHKNTAMKRRKLNPYADIQKTKDPKIPLRYTEELKRERKLWESRHH